MSSIPLEPGKIFNKADDRGWFHHFHPPFEIKRMYFIEDYDTSVIRGMHLHEKERKAFYCVRGGIVVVYFPVYQQKSEELGKVSRVALSPSDDPVVIGAGNYMGIRTLKSGSLYLAMSDQKFDPSDDKRLDPEPYRKYFEVQNR